MGCNSENRAKDRTAAGIIIPDAAQDKPTEGIVLAIGPGKYETEKGEEKKKEKEKKKKFIATVLRPGQRIIYGKYSAREFEFDGETIVLVREEDVLGTVEDFQLVEKQSFAVAKKPANPLAVKKEWKVMTVAAPPVQKKKPVEKKTVKKDKPATKIVEMKKVSGKKPAEKKTIVKKAAPKPAKKTTPVKKVKAAERKVEKKKTAIKKSVQKKTDVQKKKAVQKKTAVKASKKTVPSKAVAVKKKQTAKKPLAKGKAKPKK